MYQARLRGEEAVVLEHPSPQVNEGITVTYRRDVHHQFDMTEIAREGESVLHKFSQGNSSRP